MAVCVTLVCHSVCVRVTLSAMVTKPPNTGIWHPMPVMDHERFKPHGKCIYCGARSDLTDEHIIPFGLGGNAILPKSSCERCAEITGRDEQRVLRGELWAVRILMALQSRSNHEDAPKAFPIEIVQRGKTRVYQLAIENYPVVLHFPRFELPGIFRLNEYSQGIQFSRIDSLQFGPSPKEVASRLKAEALRWTHRQDPNAFARVIAKIGYAMAAANGDLELLDSPSPAVPAILGQEDTIGKWVGCLEEPNVAEKGMLHRIDIVHDTEQGFLIAEVQIFRNSETPRYVVFLGYLKRPHLWGKLKKLLKLIWRRFRQTWARAFGRSRKLFWQIEAARMEFR